MTPMLKIETSEWREFVLKGAEQLGIGMSPRQAELLATHASAMLKWNEKINLTAITDPEEVAVKHYLDAIAALPLVPEKISLLDLGSGGGFPGIPLKIMKPSIAVTFLDSKRKKINFLKYVTRILGMENAAARHARIEALYGDNRLQRSFDIIVCRAFAELKQFVRQAIPFLKEEGMLIAYKGKDVAGEMESLSQLPFPDTQLEATLKTYTLPYLNIRRTLVVIRTQPV